MPFIVKFPIEFASDQTTVVTSNPVNQFETFFRVPIASRIVDPNYGIGEDMFLKKNLYSINEIAYLYYIDIRNRFKSYIRNIYISRIKAEFDRSTKSIFLNIFYVIDSEEKFVKYKIAEL